jgi:hypothetical protein
MPLKQDGPGYGKERLAVRSTDQVVGSRFKTPVP